MTDKLQEWVNEQVTEVAKTHREECKEQRKKVIPVCIVVGILVPVLFGMAKGLPIQKTFTIFGSIGIVLACCMVLIVLLYTASTKRVKVFRQQYIQQLENNLTETEQQLFSEELQSGTIQTVPLKCGKNKLLKPKLLFGSPFFVCCDEYGSCLFIKLSELDSVEFEGNLFSHSKNQSGDAVAIHFNYKEVTKNNSLEDCYMSMREAEQAYQTLRQMFPELTIKIIPIKNNKRPI